MENPVAIADFWVGKGDLVMIAGPCVIESAELTLAIARTLKDYAAELNLPLIFKASYDKANRTSLTSFRGPGLAQGLEILARVKDEVGLPVLSDVHQVADVETAARVLDVLQIPDRTPVICVEIPGHSPDTVLLYGHLDKQPPMEGWTEGLGPWTPVIRDGRLYGRGAGDDDDHLVGCIRQHPVRGGHGKRVAPRGLRRPR